MKREVPDYEIYKFKEKRTDYCVGIPLINEGDKIKQQLLRMQEIGIDNKADIFIFDGGSDDGSTDLDFLKSCGVCALLVKLGAGKQGAQFRMGFDYILKQGYKGIVTIDGNGKDSVESIPDFIHELSNGVDFIQGSRFMDGGTHVNTPLSRLIAVKLIHAPWISMLSGFKYTDTTSAFRGISKKLLEDEDLNIFRDIFSAYELLFYMSVKAPRLNYNIKEIPVTRSYPKDAATPTKIKMSGNFKIIKTLLRLTFGYYANK